MMFLYRKSDDGTGYVQVVNTEAIELGIAPNPKTMRQNLIYHICHGLIMQYPIRDILAFAWRNRRSFETEMVDGEPLAVFEFVYTDSDGNVIGDAHEASS